MTLFQTVKIWFLGLFNRYEAGVRWGTSRSQIPGEVRDQRYDSDPPTRLEIVRKSRYFQRNNALMNRLGDLFEQYTVGPNGIPITADSSDPKWNEVAMAWWNEWCKYCDVETRHHLTTIQSLIARSWFFDGEIFIVKTAGEVREPEEPGAPPRPSQFPRIQLVESHRCATPGERVGRDDVIDGVKIDQRGRTIGYYMRVGVNDEDYRLVPADRIIHVGEPSRKGEYRYLPFSYPVLNDLHDLDDLEIMEMRAAKDAADKSTFIKNATGELNTDDRRRDRYSVITKTSAGVDITQNRVAQIKAAIGGKVAALRTGEDVTQFVSNRPSVAQQWYWDYLISKICAGVGISKLLVYPWSMQGTVTRADLDVMAGFFKARSFVIQCAVEEIWRYVIGWAIKNDRRLADPPHDWAKVTCRPPRSPNVDVGRNSSAMIAEFEAKLRTAASVFAELGEDWRESYRQIAREEAFRIKLEQEMVLPPGTMSKAIEKALERKAAAAVAIPAGGEDEGSSEDGSEDDLEAGKKTKEQKKAA